MLSGKVKWFNDKKGFGFLTDHAGKDYFVHVSGLLDKSMKLAEGMLVKFEVIKAPKGEKAVQVELE